MKLCEVIEDDAVRYMASVRSRGKVVYTSPPYLDRDEAARDVFTAMPKAKSCSTSRAFLVNGEWSDRMGSNIYFHERYQVMR